MPARLGQHFLADAAAARRIAAVAKPTDGAPVLEIGGGRGALTDHLALNPGELTVLELDRALAARLAQRYPGRPVRVLQGDIREQRLEALDTIGGRRWVVAGNIPYALTSEILVWLCEQWRLVRRAVLMVQSEVADRVVAEPGGKTYGRLTVLVRYRAVPTRLFDLPPTAFDPPPKVRSAVVCLDFLPQSAVAPDDEARFHALVEHGFRWRRKTLRSVLRRWRGWTAEQAEASLGAAGIEPERRAETLSLVEFAALSDAIGGVV